MTTSNPVCAEPLALQFKAGLVPILSLELYHSNLDFLERQLAEKTRQSPEMFNNSPVILSLNTLPDTDCTIDIQGLLALCERYGIKPIAARSDNTQLVSKLSDAGITLMAPAIQKAAPTKAPSAPPKSNKNNTVLPSSSRIVNTPIRSGQQVIAPEGDLIVTAQVSAGAELLAHGNIHIYGPLRGRALAGINGNIQARIFCQSFEAELVAIAGNYCNDSDPKHWKKAVNISLFEDQLTIDPLG